MKLTNTWRRRISGMARGGAKFIVAVLVVCAAINGVSIVWHWVFPPHPPAVAATARTVGNQSKLVEAHAIDCVTTWLTASRSRAQEVYRCFSDRDKRPLPTSSPLIVTAPAASATLMGQTLPDVTTYGVIVAVTQQPYTNAPPTRAYYQLPVSVYGTSAPRAMGRPARIDPPPAGADVELAYPVTVTTDAAVTGVISGFVSCFLTEAAGLERFVTTDSGLWPVKGYASATVEAVRAQNKPSAVPDDGATLRVWVSVTARAPDYSTFTQDYPLTLRASGGAWSVAGVDAVPAVNPDATPSPVAMPR